MKFKTEPKGICLRKKAGTPSVLAQGYKASLFKHGLDKGASKSTSFFDLMHEYFNEYSSFGMFDALLQ